MLQQRQRALLRLDQDHNYYSNRYHISITERQEGQAANNMMENRPLNTGTELFINVPIRKIGIKISNLILNRGSSKEEGQG